jgi:hypothetical protein
MRKIVLKEAMNLKKTFLILIAAIIVCLIVFTGCAKKEPVKTPVPATPTPVITAEPVESEKPTEDPEASEDPMMSEEPATTDKESPDSEVENSE